ncbi:MAG: asparaginase domain-containing protein, partial [Oscillospiraceae bacterium]|nr:asparaginase domain-containing protein [Oscillospiraceae bacterium]
MKKILWIQTGGTFDCRATPRGLSPHEVSVNTGSPANSCSDLHEIDELRLFAADSTDITPAHWKILARAVFEHAQNPAYRAFIITHGTDTMQYTAAALSLMLENFDKPVILTGASKAPATKDSDAAANFSAAIGAIAGLQCGVYVVFGGKIIPGLCAIKLNSHTCEFIDAALTSFPEKPNPHAPPILRDKLCEDVFYLKITPQIHPDIADFLLEKGYKGVI